MKEFYDYDICKKTLEVFEDYDGTWMYISDKSVENMNNAVHDALVSLGTYLRRNYRYLLDDNDSIVPAYLSIYFNGFLSQELIEIKGRKIYNEIFVLNRIWCNGKEFEKNEIEEALKEIDNSNLILYTK